MRLQSSPVSIGIPSEKTMGIGVFKRQALNQDLFAPEGWWWDANPHWVLAGSNNHGYFLAPAIPSISTNSSTDGATWYLDADEGAVTYTLHAGRSYRLTGKVLGVAGAATLELVGQSTDTFVSTAGLWESFDLIATPNSDFKLKVSSTINNTIYFVGLKLRHV